MESLEERVRFLEAETRELKVLLDEKDEKIDTLIGTATTIQNRQLYTRAIPIRRKSASYPRGVFPAFPNSLEPLYIRGRK
jgi:hypothetical protein